jgi:uncharacterized protein (DUF1499 family)
MWDRIYLLLLAIRDMRQFWKMWLRHTYGTHVERTLLHTCVTKWLCVSSQSYRRIFNLAPAGVCLGGTQENRDEEVAYLDESTDVPSVSPICMLEGIRKFDNFC